MKQTFVSYTSRRASSNCHILIWIAIATRRANMGCRNTTWSPLSACLTSKLSIIDSVTLTLSSSLSLALSLSLSHSPQFSHTLLPLSNTHSLFVTFTDFVLLTGIAALHWLRLSISISISGAWSRHGGPLWQCQCWRSYHMDVQWSHWSHEERRDRHRDELCVWDSCS